MSLTDLLKDAQQRQQELQAVEDHKAEAKEKEHQEALAIEKEEFETQLKMYAGDIFDRLDDAPQIEPRRHGGTVLRVNVFHRTIHVSMCDKSSHSEPTGTWKVCDRLRREYWGTPKISCSDKQEYVSGCKLLDYLLLRILEISEDHDHLLKQIEIMNFEKAKQEKTEAQEREAEEHLRLFGKALEVMQHEHSSKKISALVEAAIADQWTWPEDFVLDLYKVSWCTGAYRSDEEDGTVFDYDSGWSLSDIPVSEPEYFVLLPERYGSARTVKTSSPLTVEHFRFTEATLPDRLFDLPKKLDIELVSIKLSGHGYNQYFKLLPEFVPPSPEGCKVSTAKHNEGFDLRKLPCIEIRQAIDKVVAEATPGTMHGLTTYPTR